MLMLEPPEALAGGGVINQVWHLGLIGSSFLVGAFVTRP
jgi:hypothetical protein